MERFLARWLRAHLISLLFLTARWRVAILLIGSVLFRNIFPSNVANLNEFTRWSITNRRMKRRGKFAKWKGTISHWSDVDSWQTLRSHLTSNMINKYLLPSISDRHQSWLSVDTCNAFVRLFEGWVARIRV